MKIRKKLMVWGAFLLMGIIIAGCAEESYFDSVVSVDDSASKSNQGKGLGSRAKANIGDALTDLLSGDENENVAEEGSGDGAYVEAEEPGDVGIGDGGMPANSYVAAPSEEPSKDTSKSSVASSGLGDSGKVGKSLGSGDLDKGTKKEGSLEKPGEKIGEVSGNDDEEPVDEDVKESEVSGNNEDEELPEDTELPVDTELPSEEEPEEEEPATETPVVVEKEEDSKSFGITVLLINETGAKFGMISVIDPVSKEQVRVGALGKDEMIIMELSWPNKEKTFRMGIYDALGNLLQEESVDFKGITSGGVITLKGDGSITEVVAEIE